MKKKILYLPFLLLPLLFVSCIFSPSIKGNGNVKEEKRHVSDFDGIKTSRGINVYITQGDEINVVVKADENLLDFIETGVKDGVLNVRSTRMVRWAESFKVLVTVPDLEMIEASSGSNVYSEKKFKTDELETSASSGANMTLKLDVKTLAASASSGANLNLKGLAEEISARVSSGANIKAGDLKTRNAELKAGSGGNIWISAQKKLDASASSGGNIHYSGEPSESNISTSSGGNVIKM